MSEEGIIKIILIGNSGVGKTSIINRFYLNNFDEKGSITISANFVAKSIKIDGQNIMLNIWDTAGEEKFRSINKIFVKDSNIIIFVYDITTHKSFEELDYWYQYIINELGKEVIFGLAGNKADRVEEEDVSREEGEEKSKELGAIFALLSAKEDKIRIDSFFYNLVKIYLENPLYKTIRRRTIKINKNDMKKKKDPSEGGCCGKKKIDKS